MNTVYFCESCPAFEPNEVKHHTDEKWGRCRDKPGIGMLVSRKDWCMKHPERFWVMEKTT